MSNLPDKCPDCGADATTIRGGWPYSACGRYWMIYGVDPDPRWEPRMPDCYRRQIASLRDLLQRLYDVTNGCPLPKYQADWDQVMAEVAAALGGGE